MLGSCFLVSRPLRLIPCTHWIVGSVGSISYLHGLENRKPFALARNRTVSPRFTTFSPVTTLNTLTQLPLLKISRFTQRKRRCLYLQSVLTVTNTGVCSERQDCRSWPLSAICLLYLYLDAFESLRNATVSFVRCVCVRLCVRMEELGLNRKNWAWTGRTGLEQEELGLNRKNWAWTGRTGLEQEELGLNRKNFREIWRSCEKLSKILAWLNYEKEASNLHKNVGRVMVMWVK